MELQDLKGKLVAVLGYGLEGKSVTEYLLKHGIKPVLFDQRPWGEWSVADQEQIRALGINFIFGPDCFKELAGFEVAFRSPGIRLSQVTSDKLQVTSQTKWFFEHCPAKIIGVTGTKGKGTTSALIYEMLKEDTRYKILDTSGSIAPSSTSHLTPNTYLTGNIGKVQPLDILDGLKPDDCVVYELSSFQLQDLDRSPHIAVVLITTSEHMDYHKDHNEYLDAKTAIAKFQTADDVAIINADFENSIKIGEQGKGKKLYFSRQKTLDNGCFVKNDEIIIAGADFSLPIASLQLRGVHNLENVCAAILTARFRGLSDEAIKKAAANFKGLEHRLEFVTEKGGIKFYNDSFSTTPETAIAAIKSFGERLVLILGGSSKNSDFAELGQTIHEAKNIKAIILIGGEALQIKAAMNYEGKIFEGAKNMKEIFAQIKSIAKKGDVVLLSPACASFDMFEGYVDRGCQFKEAVKDF